MNRLIYSLVALAVTLSTYVISPVFAQDETKSETAPVEFSTELKGCLESSKTGIGKELYTELADGIDVELPDEAKKNADGCFEQHPPQAVGGAQSNPTNLSFSPATEECLTKALGGDFKSKMISLGKEARGSISGCFGVGVVGGPKGLDEFKSCVTAAVGEADAKKMFETATPPTPGSPLSTKLFNAGCGKKMQHQFGGERPPMPPEMAACFEKNGFNVKSQVVEDVGEAKVAEIQKACNIGGPNGPGGAKAAEMMACLQGLGIDPKQATRGAAAGVVSTTEIEASKKCAQQVGFQPGGHGGSMPEDIRRCLEGKGIAVPAPQAMRSGHESQFNSWIRSNFIASAQESPPPRQPDNLPQGGPQGGPPQLNPDQQKEAQGCFRGPGGGQGVGPGGPGNNDPGHQKCFQEAGATPGAGTPLSEDKVKLVRECMSKNNIGGFGPGPGGPNNGQPGPNGQPGGPNCGEQQKVRGVEKIRQFLALGPGDREGQDQQPGNGPQCGQHSGGPNGSQNGQREGQQPGQNCGETQRVRGIAKIRQLLALGPGDQGQQPGNGPQCGQQPGGPNGPQDGQQRPIEGQFQNNQPGFNGQQPPPGGQQFQGSQSGQQPPPPPTSGQQNPPPGGIPPV